MVLREELGAKYQRSSCLNEAVHEVVRIAKACGPVSNENAIRALEDDSVDEACKSLLLGLLACQEDYALKKRVLGDDSMEEEYRVVVSGLLDDVTECKKRSVAHKKRKEIDVSDDAEGECDPQYEQFLKHLKTHDKSYVLEFEEDDGSVLIKKYEGEIGSDIESDPEQALMSKVEKNRTCNVVSEKISEEQDWRLLSRGYKSKRGPSDRVCGVENQHKRGKTGKTDRMVNVDGQFNAKHVVNCSVGMDKGYSVLIEKINHQRQESGRNLPRTLKPKSGFSNQMSGRENQRCVSNKKTKRPARERSRNEAEREKNQHKPDNLHEKISNIDEDECIGGPRKRKTRGNLPGPVKTRIGIPSWIPRVENQEYTWSKKGKSPTHEKKSRNETKRCDRNVRLDNDPHVSMHMNQAGKINHQKQGNGGNSLRAVKPKTEFPNQMSGVENQQYTLAKKTKSPTCGKSRNETNREMNHVRVHIGHCMEYGNMTETNGRKKQPGRNLHGERKQNAEPANEVHQMKNCREFYPQNALSKNTKSSTPKRLMNRAKNVKTEECSGEEHRRVKVEKCFMAYDECESDSKVEILDEAACVRNEISNPFVPAKRLDKSMDEDGILHIGGSSRTDVFRKEVLDVLTKPYDAEEYTRLRQTVQDGGYLKYHPEIAGKFKLHKYRYNRRRRLAIFRGFFFWLQNLSREGSFKPWKDGVCLGVEPPYKRDEK